MNEVVARINEMNAESAAWVAEDPDNRFAGELCNDPAHWAEYGVTTVAELEAYFDECAEREAYKERKPRVTRFGNSPRQQVRMVTSRPCPTPVTGGENNCNQVLTNAGQ
jgi:hypothetical protein